MKLKSLQELECLLPEEDRREALYERNYKELVARRPFSMQTKYRVIPLLPNWMRKKLIEAKELFNNNNTEFGDYLYWNHTITLPLDEQHEITFAILDDYLDSEGPERPMKKIIEVYKDLQVLYRKYGHSLTIVSMQSGDFGMYLPYSSYESESDSLENTQKTKNTSYSFDERSLEDFITDLFAPRYTRIHLIENWAAEYSKNLNETDRVKFNTWFAYHHKSMTDYVKKMDNILDNSSHNYFVQPMWDCIDLYMHNERDWEREFCIKWNINENLSHLKKLDSLRPLINSIIKKTKREKFAFGVKKKNTSVVYCNPVNAR